AATAARRIDRKFACTKFTGISIVTRKPAAAPPSAPTGQPFRPPILQTKFHSVSLTGCTDRRPYFTSAMFLSFGSALIAESVTGFGNGFSATAVTATHGSPLPAVGSGNDSLATLPIPTTCFSSPV